MGKAEMVQAKTVPLAALSGQPPSENLACRDAKRMSSELSNYYTEYEPLIARSEHREWTQLYLLGSCPILNARASSRWSCANVVKPSTPCELFNNSSAREPSMIIASWNGISSWLPKT